MHNRITKEGAQQQNKARATYMATLMLLQIAMVDCLAELSGGKREVAGQNFERAALLV